MAAFDLVVANGTVVTATDTYQADLAVRDGVIVQIGGAIDTTGAGRVIDSTGRYVLPGGVDTHTHLDSANQGVRTADDFRSGTIAAACGGTTTVVDFCWQAKGQTLAEALAAWDAKAQGQAVVDYGYHTVITDLPDAVAEELATMPGRGMSSFKIFMAYKGASQVDDTVLYRTLRIARAQQALVMVHAENGDAIAVRQQELLTAGHTAPRYHAVSRPPRTEAEATGRAIALAELAEAPLFVVHVSCAEALDEIVRGRARGVTVLAETCPQYLYLTEDDLDRPGFDGAKFVFTPPPRAAQQQAILWRALADGTLQAVTSDHCPFNLVGGKDRGRDDFTQIPNGAPGVEERLVLVYQGVIAGRLSLNRFVELVATAPARIFGLWPAKGTIAVGSDADLVLWHPDAAWTLSTATLHSRIDYCMYEGMRVYGLPETVILRGQVIVEGRSYVGPAGGGRFIRRTPFSTSHRA
jgi:dihydropyrimidinase